MCEEYNGWTNRETWATMLYIDNDEGLINPLTEVAKQLIEEEGNNGISALSDMAQEVESFISDDVLNFDNISTNRNAFLMLSDIGSLYRVNWREIAESLLENVKEEANA